MRFSGTWLRNHNCDPYGLLIYSILEKPKNNPFGLMLPNMLVVAFHILIDAIHDILMNARDLFLLKYPEMDENIIMDAAYCSTTRELI